MSNIKVTYEPIHQMVALPPRGSASKVATKIMFFVLVFSGIAISKSANSIDCVAGEYFLSGSCIQCSEGFFQAIPAQDYCRSCPLHMTTSFAGAATYTDCICDTGYYMGENAQICTPCPNGDCDTCHLDEFFLTCEEVLHVGDNHACVLFPCSKKMKCWGDGNKGQLVNDEVLCRRKDPGQNCFMGEPLNLGLLEDDLGDDLAFSNVGTKDVIDISTSSENTCVLFHDGTAKCWGSDTRYETGFHPGFYSNGNTKAHPSMVGKNPAQDDMDEEFGDGMAVIDIGGKILQIRSCFESTCVLMDDYTVKCWGHERAGGLGNGNSAWYYRWEVQDAHTLDFGTNLHAVHLFPPAKSPGVIGLCARLNTGDVVCWGWQSSSNLGYDGQIPGTDRIHPKGYVDGSDGELIWESLNTGQYDGDNRWPALNQQTKHTIKNERYIMHLETTPTAICFLMDDATIGCSGESIVVENTNPTYAGEENGAGEGNGAPGMPVDFTGYGDIVQLTVGDGHACVRFLDKSVICWGANSYGQLGVQQSRETVKLQDAEWKTATMENRVYVNVDQVSSDSAVLPVSKFLSVVASRYGVCGILNDRGIKCWGRSEHGLAGTIDGYYGLFSPEYGDSPTPDQQRAQERGENAKDGFGVCFYENLCGEHVPLIDLGSDIGCCASEICGIGPCIHGQYTLDLVNCLPCPTNSTTTTTKSSECTYTCQRGEKSQEGLTCIPCAPGSFKNSTGVGECTLCDLDTYSDEEGAAVCTDCPSGQMSDDYGGTGCTTEVITDASACIAGTSLSDRGVCRKCSIGTFQGLPGQTSCRICPIGKTTASLGGAVYTDCVCPAMSYKDSYGWCEPCPEGSIALIGSSFCACPLTGHITAGASDVDCTAVLGFGDSHTCVFYPCLKKIKCWGSNAEGQLGLNKDTGTIGNHATDMGDNLLYVPVDNVIGMRVASTYTCVFTDESEELVYKCWGENRYNRFGSETRVIQQLGLVDGDVPGRTVEITASSFGAHALLDVQMISSIAQCALLSMKESDVEKSFDDVAGGRRVRRNKIVCWGHKDYRGVYSGDQSDFYEMPANLDRIPSNYFGEDLYPVQMWAGRLTLCARMQTGDVKCWGRNGQGLLGVGDRVDFMEKKSRDDRENQLPVNVGNNYVHTITSHMWHACALLDNQKVTCWGSCQAYMFELVGAGRREDSYETFKPRILEDGSIKFVDFGHVSAIKKIALGDQTNCVLFASGQLKCWGRGYKVLGYGDWAPRGTVVGSMGDDLPNITLDSEIVDIFVDTYCCALTKSGKVKCWGQQDDDYQSSRTNWEITGRLGHGTGDDWQGTASAAPYTDLGANISCFRTHFNIIDDPICQPCAPGSFAVVAGLDQCKQCSAGTFGNEIAAVNSDTCKRCNVNTYSQTAGAAECQVCQNGTEQPDIGATECIQNFVCDPGEYFREARNKCEKCPPKTFQTLTNSTFCIACPSDYTTTLEGGATTCIPKENLAMCIPGEYFDIVIELCLKCAIGTFQALPAQYSCRACPINHTTAFLGGAIYTDCVCPAMSYKDPYGFCEPCKDESVSTVGQTFCTCSPNNVTERASRTDCSSVLTCGQYHCCLLFPCLEKVKCWGSGPLGSNSRDNIGDEPGELGSNLPFLPFDNVKGVTCHYDATCLKFHQDGSSFFRCFGKNRGIVNTYMGVGLLMHGDLKNYGYSASDSSGSNDYPVEQTPHTSADTFNEFELLDLVHSYDFSCFLLSQTMNVAATGGRLIRKSVLKCFGNRYVEGLEAGTGTSWGDPRVTINKYTDPQNAIAIDFGSFLYPIQIFTGGMSSMCARMQTGHIKCWGQNYNKILGKYLDNNNPGYGSLTMGDNLPFLDLGNDHYVISMLTMQTSARCVVMDDGNVKCWGKNEVHGLGSTTTDYGMGGDVLIGTSLPVKQIALSYGESNAVVLLSDGTIKAWGINAYGQLGYGDTVQRGHTPDTVGSNLPSIWVGAPVVSLQGFMDGFCAMPAEGPLKCWGYARAALAHGNMDIYDPPISATETPISDIGEVSQYSCFRTNFELPCARTCMEGVGWNVGQWQCVPCAPGTYNAMIDTSQCQLCPPNTYSVTVAAKISSTCIACNDNSYSHAGSSYCLCNQQYGYFS